MRHIRLPRRLHLSPQEKDLRCLKLLGTEFAILSVIVAATYVVSIASARESDVPFRSIVPSNWTLAPPAPQSYGRRFVSPTGDAWLWFFAVPVNREAAVSANADQFAQSRLRKSAQDDKWSFCPTAGTLCPTNQERQ